MAKNLWGGRFTGKSDETFTEFNNSLKFDKRLFAADIRGSLAHAEGILAAGILTKAEFGKIKRGLDELRKLASKPAAFDGSDAEDVHSFIEGKLVDMIGDADKKLHTGRSRNDQVATAFRIWLRDEIDVISETVKALQSSLIAAAERHPKAVLPGYTHLQRAQPVTWAHWCLAYFEM